LKRLLVLLFSVLWIHLCLHSLFAEEKRTYTTGRVNPSPPVIDGRLDDTAWEAVEWGGDFIQREPYEGKEPSQETAFKILYDDDNVYVGIRAYDTQPDSIVMRMSRRDDEEGDIVAVQFDSYFDHLTAFTFMVNAAGVKMDAVFINDGESEDDTWDPVWYVDTSVDDQGWSAEMRIPLSQLRFGKQESQIWGLQVARYLFRKDELSCWQHIPQDASGWVHNLGELHGIVGIKPSMRVEFLPYSMGKTETMRKEDGNPFTPGRANNLDLGLDGKIGITSDLTLDFTINPDFGQVEADPSVVNLTAFETFYEEKRPFFIEGSNILNYRLMIGDGDFSFDNLFYSRRIGRFPSHEPDVDDDAYVEMPERSSILGAMKITGKTRSGLSIGVMDAVTTKERAEIDYLDQRYFETVEPLTNYFLGRLQKDFRNGATKIGGIITHTHRNIEDSYLEFLNRSAITGGIDFEHSWKDRNYTFTFTNAFSHIRGTEEAMLEAQTASRRYFQRPDADHVEVDSSRTSLSGYGGTLLFSKVGSGHINFIVGGTWRSPELELNDMGYLQEGDKIMQFVWAQYREWEPFSIFRSLRVNFNQWSGWNFGRENIFNGGNVNLSLQFKNYWELSGGVGHNFEGLSASSLRGGPSLRYQSRWNNWYYVGTDGRKALRASFSGSDGWVDDGYSQWHSFSPGMTWQPSNALSFSLSPFYNINKDDLQYVDTIELDDGDRYLFGRIDQKTLGLVVRLNYCITPTLTIQYYGQPFVSAGEYSRFKHITDSRAERYEDRFHTFGDAEIEYDADAEEYYVDENIDGIVDYGFELPDFNFRQFRSNLVVRWEYTPGSTVHLVWSQERTGCEAMGDFAFWNDVDDLFHEHPHDVFLIKFNRWFSL